MRRSVNSCPYERMEHCILTWVRCDFRHRIRYRLQQRAFAGIRETHQSDVGNQLQIQTDRFRFANVAQERVARTSATAAARHNAHRLRLIQIGQTATVVQHRHTARHFDAPIDATPSEQAQLGSVLTVTGGNPFVRILAQHSLERLLLGGHKANAPALSTDAAVFGQPVAAVAAFAREPQCVDELAAHSFRYWLWRGD